MNRLICINPSVFSLTVGKAYDYTNIVIHKDIECYVMCNDAGYEGWFPSKCFIDLTKIIITNEDT